MTALLYGNMDQWCDCSTTWCDKWTNGVTALLYGNMDQWCDCSTTWCDKWTNGVTSLLLGVTNGPMV